MQWRRLSFEGSEATLAAELVLPDGAGPHPAVVLLHGAGEGARGFYRPHATAFAHAGVAALIFDRRGEGESTGDRVMNLFTLGKDAAAAVRALREAPLVDPARVGLWGYSNGAWVATLAAGECGPAFLVLAGAAGVSAAEAEVFRRTDELRRAGAGTAGLAAVEQTWRTVFAYMAGAEWAPTWDAELAACEAAIAADPVILNLPITELAKASPHLDAVPRFGSPLFAGLKERMRGVAADMAFDPIPRLEQIDCPVLVVLAEHDANVPVPLSLPRFEALARQRPATFEVRVLPGADHLFSSEAYAASGVGESPGAKRSAADYRPDFLAPMGEWMARASGGSPRRARQ